MDSKRIFENVKLLKTTGFGVNKVNHEVRTEFDISVSEYCVADVIAQRRKKDKPTTLFNISTFIGINGDVAESAVNKLIKKQLATYKNGHYYLKKRFYEKLIEKENFSKEFEEFWTIEEDGKSKTAWPGPKQKAYELFQKARDSGKEFVYIMNQRNWYFKMLSLPSQQYRQKMIATRFLNLKSGELDQDFKGQYEEFKKKEEKNQKAEDKIKTASAMTVTDFKKEFQDD